MGKAVSRKQQMAAGAALAAKRGGKGTAGLRGASKDMARSMSEDRRLAFAHRQLGAVLYRMAFALEAPDDRVAAVVGPVDDVDELAAEEVEDGHACIPASRARRAPPATL